jgi:hypothetical protein
MERDFELPLNQTGDEASYYTILPYLKDLQEQVRQVRGPSARDLIKSLDGEASSAGYYTTLASSDAFFKSFPEIARLEASLIAKLTPDNVSEVLQLIHEADCYQPTNSVFLAIKAIYLTQLYCE